MKDDKDRERTAKEKLFDLGIQNLVVELTRRCKIAGIAMTFLADLTDPSFGYEIRYVQATLDDKENQPAYMYYALAMARPDLAPADLQIIALKGVPIAGPGPGDRIN